MSEQMSQLMGGSLSREPTLLSLMLRYRYVILLVTLLAAVLGYVVSSRQAPIYEASATIVLADEVFGEGSDPERRVEQEAIRLASRDVLERATELVDEPDAARWVDEVTVSPDPLVGILQVTARSNEAETSAQIANAVASAYQLVSTESAAARANEAVEILRAREEELTDQLSDVTAGDNGVLQSQVTAIQRRIAELTTQAAVFGAGVSDVEEAEPPAEPSSPNPLRDSVAVGVMGFIVASGLAYWRGMVSSEVEVNAADVLGTPLLARIPQFKQSEPVLTGSIIDPAASEAYQFLVSSIEYSLASSGARSVLVSSALAGDGKSVTALHLATALALQRRHDVMLVDSDIRARGLTSMLRADAEGGLVALASGIALNEVVRQYRVTDHARLKVVPAGQPVHQVSGLLATEPYRAAIANVIENSDLTIFDSGPLLTVADASAIAMQVDAILLVIDSGISPANLRRLRERLRLLPTPLLGCVINRAGKTDSSVYPYATARSSVAMRLREFFKDKRVQTNNG